MFLCSPLRRVVSLGALAFVLSPTLVAFAQSAAPTARATGASATPAAQTGTLKPLTLEDYGRWNRIGSTALSADGKWMTYGYTPLEGTGTLYVKQLDGSTLYTIPRGSGIVFSDNSRYVAYFIDPPTGGRGGRGGTPAGGGRGRGATTPAADAAPQAASRTFKVMDLQNGDTTSFPGIASFSFSPDGGSLLLRPQGATPVPAADAAPAGGRGGRGGGGGGGGAVAGSDLIIYDLATKTQRAPIANVAQSAFDDSGKLFAYTVVGTQRFGNGVYLMNFASGDIKTLDAAIADYEQLTWSAEGANLAVLRGDKARDKAYKDNTLLVWTNVGTPNQKAVVFDPAKASGAPTGMVLSEFAALRFSDDGSRVWLGLKAQEAEYTAPTGAQANVDVWHWKDPQPQSVQIIQVAQDRRSTMSAVYDLATNSVRQVADSSMRQVTPTDNMKWAVGRNDKAYLGEIAWGGSHGDYYRVNLGTGELSLIEKGLSRVMGFSPDDKWYLYQQNGHVFVYELATGKKQQIDGGKNFVDAQDDHDYEKPVYGLAGWASDGQSVLLYDRYDVWQLPVRAGTPVNITKGEGTKQEVRFRVQSLAAGGAGGRGGRGGGRGGRGGGEAIDLAKPVMLSAYGEWTKKSGYFTLEAGQAPKPLIWADKSIGAPQVAKSADRIMFTEQTFNEYPDYWVSSKAFAAPAKVTNANPFLSEYAWGSKKLIDYKNRFGQHLQATLTLPAGYEPGKKYPMLVYFYELMSNTHHSFSQPAFDDRPHISTYSSNGYLVLQPDVVYEIGRPGTSAVDCVTAAVKEVIRQGYADPAHIGLQGHSWGGYQSSFILTQTNMFAAVVTGAPPTDLTSFVGTTYGSTGTLQQGITEVGQVRMGFNRTPWNSHELYESQSAVHNVTKITTPFMILHGTADNAVDWHQGLEYYAAARRVGKEVILLSYPDEPHHLGRKENQLDFQVRMRQFFDHYLKGTPAPKWMTEGVPQVLKGRENLPIPTPRTTGGGNNH